jgi:hypothetical protein
MTHPSESRLIDRFLEGEPDPEVDRHLESCAGCRAKIHSMEVISAHLSQYTIPDCDGETAEDVFAAAWAKARENRMEERSAMSWVRWGLRPATVFGAGLFLGYLLFSNGDPGAERNPPLESGQEVKRPPAEVEKLPDTRMNNEYWEKTGFRNAKFTPSLRYEGNREVWGGTLEAETPGGALVVMNY